MGEDFWPKCEAVFEGGKRVAITDRILVYSTLSNVCAELSGDNNSESMHNHRLSQSFAALTLQSVAALPVLMAPSFAAVEALVSAVRTSCTVHYQYPH